MGADWPEGPLCSGPLSGLRVLDLSRILAGPFSAMILGDLGADVIKVEQPTGDETRRWGPPFIDGTAAYYLAANRNKRSVVLDLRDGPDRRIASQLVDAADVIIENFLPGSAEKFDLGYDTVRTRNPRVIYCSITGFARDSSEANRKGYDLLIQAIGGLMGVTGPEGGAPAKVGVAISDLSAGLFSTIGVLAALAERGDTGKGARVEVALIDAQVSMLANQAMSWLAAGENPVRLGSDHPNVAPYGAFATATTDIVLGAGTDAQFAQLCDVLDRPDLKSDPRFKTNAARVDQRGDLREELEQTLVTRDADVWMARCAEAEVICGPIRTIKDVFDDPYVSERLVRTVNDPTLGPIPQVVSPIRVNGRTIEINTPPPGLGSDTAAIRAFFSDEDGH